jgi:dimethylargininase
VNDARIALVRRPGPRLAEGIVTHIERVTVDIDLARRQHAAYVDALDRAGFDVREVAPADDCPDAVFIEDTVVMLGPTAVLTLPGAPQRRPEIAGTEAALRELGAPIERIEEPATLDGGDVLVVGSTVYVGRGGRTNAAGVSQLRDIARRHGRTVVAVPVERVLHLKSAITALPDGTFVTWPDLVDARLFPAVRLAREETGAHVVVLGDADVLIAASAPRTAAMIADLGFHPVVVDIGEFEKLEGCVTCLSVLMLG